MEEFHGVNIDQEALFAVTQQEILNLFEDRAEVFGHGAYTVGEISEMLGAPYMETGRMLLKMVEQGILQRDTRQTGISEYSVIPDAAPSTPAEDAE